MKLGYLQLNSYRNCEETILNFDKGKTLIIGKNAQGKTNILESIYFLSTLKSPRTSNTAELINFKSAYCKIEAKIQKNGTNTDLQYIYSKDKKRELKVNGTKASVKDFKSVLTTVLFSSSDLLSSDKPASRKCIRILTSLCARSRLRRETPATFANPSSEA